MIDYLEIAQKNLGGRNDGFLTDVPRPIQLADDDYVHVRYDVQSMRWIPNRPSRIKYPTAKELIKQYRCRRLVEALTPREYTEKLR